MENGSILRNMLLHAIRFWRPAAAGQPAKSAEAGLARGETLRASAQTVAAHVTRAGGGTKSADAGVSWCRREGSQDIFLRLFESMEYDQIAASLAISVDAARHRFNRAIPEMRRALKLADFLCLSAINGPHADAIKLNRIRKLTPELIGVLIEIQRQSLPDGSLKSPELDDGQESR